MEFTLSVRIEDQRQLCLKCLIRHIIKSLLTRHHHIILSCIDYYSLNCVGSRVVEFTLSVRIEDQRQLCLKCLHLTLKELAAIVTMKVGCYVNMCNHSL